MRRNLSIFPAIPRRSEILPLNRPSAKFTEIALPHADVMNPVIKSCRKTPGLDRFVRLTLMCMMPFMASFDGAYLYLDCHGTLDTMTCGQRNWLGDHLRMYHSSVPPAASFDFGLHFHFSLDEFPGEPPCEESDEESTLQREHARDRRARSHAPQSLVAKAGYAPICLTTGLDSARSSRPEPLALSNPLQCVVLRC